MSGPAVTLVRRGELVMVELPTFTPRQIEVLQLLAEGERIEGVARRMYLSPWTVKVQLRALRRRVHARTTIEAVAIAFRAGLLD